MKTSARLMIFGSYVSRDILKCQVDDNKLVLVDYYARSSIASLGSRPLELPSTIQNISSKFQRRMVERDFRKDLVADLDKRKFDLLLIDLIDERFNLYLDPEDRVCTLSNELVSSGFQKDSYGGQTIASGSEEFWQLWEKGWLTLLNKLRRLGVLDRLLVNKVFWSSRTENGSNFEPHYSDIQINAANDFLHRMYKRIGSDIPPNQFLHFKQELMAGSITHTWGISPFHYVDSYYRAAIKQLWAWSSNQEILINSKEALIADTAIYSIQKVILTKEADDALVATVVCDAPKTAEFAFYIFRNGERIHTEWYGPNRCLRLEIKPEPGLYRVLGFLRREDGKVVTKYSNPLFLHPVIYSFGQAVKAPAAKERALLLQGECWKFPALYFSGREQEPLFVLLSAAVDRRKSILPAFNRWTWAESKRFPGHVLCVADPTLELNGDLELGWYIGTAEHDASKELARCIRSFAEAIGIPESKIVFWGSSGGGFGALAMARQIENATAVAINAQTDILVYAFPQPVETLKKYSFGSHSTKQIEEDFAPRVNMTEAWKNNISSRAILIQNKLDTHHYMAHFKPFWASLGGVDEGGKSSCGRHYAWVYSDPRGHVAESEEMIPAILELINQNSFTSPNVAEGILRSRMPDARR